MTKNKYINTGRFARLFRNDLLINQKAYLFTLAGLGIAIYAFTYFIMRTSRGNFSRPDSYIPLFIILLLAIGAFIGTAFPALTNQIKKSNYLLAPGSTFEKYLVQFVIRFVIFIPITFVLFWIGTHLAKASMVADSRINFDPSTIPDFHFSYLFEHIPTLRNKLITVISIFSVASVLFAGSVYFTRFALVKTFLVSGIIFGAALLSMVLFSHIFFPAETHGFNIELKPYKITDDLFNLQLAVYLLGGLSWIFFIVFGYFKLKEKEV